MCAMHVAIIHFAGVIVYNMGTVGDPYCMLGHGINYWIMDRFTLVSIDILVHSLALTVVE